MTVLKPGSGAPLEMDNAGLKKNFGVMKTITQVPTWIDCMVEVHLVVTSRCRPLLTVLQNYAEAHPKISFIHMDPGIVKSNLLNRGGIGYRILGFGMGLFATSARDCGENMTYALTDERYKSGAWHLSDKAEPVPANSTYVTPEATESVLEDYKTTVAIA